MAQKHNIQIRRGTALQWTSANPVLNSGEFGFETDTHILKIGNGSDNYADLPIIDISNNTITIGDGADTNNKYIYDYNGDTNKPGIRYKEDEDKWQFSNNGTTWIDMAASAATGIASVNDDESPTLGGNLDLNGFNVGDLTEDEVTELHTTMALQNSQAITYTEDEERKTFFDDFSNNTSDNYSGGVSSFVWDTANSRLVLSADPNKQVRVLSPNFYGYREFVLWGSTTAEQTYGYLFLLGSDAVPKDTYVRIYPFPSSGTGYDNVRCDIKVGGSIIHSGSVDCGLTDKTVPHRFGIEMKADGVDFYVDRVLIDSYSGVAHLSIFGDNVYNGITLCNNTIPKTADIYATNLIDLPSVSESDPMAADNTAKWSLVTGTSNTFNTDHYELLTDATRAIIRHRHYLNEEGCQKLTLTLPTGADGDFISLYSLSEDKTLTDGIGAGLMSDGSGNWNLCTISGTTTTEGSDSGLDDADQIIIETVFYQGALYYWIYDATATKPTDSTGTLYTTLTEGYSGIYALGNAQTFDLEGWESRCLTKVGDTNVPTTESIAWDYRVVGMQIDSTNSDPAVTIVDEDGNPMEWGTKQADQHAIWGRIRRCVIDPNNGNSITYGSNNRGDGLDLTGASGEIMVEIPIPYQKVVVDGTVTTVYFSPVAKSGYTKHAAANQRGQTDADYIYVGAFESSGTLDEGTFRCHSATGKQPVTGAVSYTDLPNDGRFTIQDAEDYHNNLGSGWGCINIWSHTLIQTLFYIEYNTLDSQTALGKGIVDKVNGIGFAGENTGAFSINDALGLNGTGVGVGTDGLVPISYRGIENLWGNAYCFVVGYNAVDTAYRVTPIAGLSTDEIPITLTEYLEGNAPLQTDGYYMDTEMSDTFPLWLPKTSGGSTSTYFSDYYYAHGTGEENVLLSGGYWAFGRFAGVGCLRSANVASHSNRYYGARSEFIRDIKSEDGLFTYYAPILRGCAPGQFKDVDGETIVCSRFSDNFETDTSAEYAVSATGATITTSIANLVISGAQKGIYTLQNYGDLYLSVTHKENSTNDEFCIIFCDNGSDNEFSVSNGTKYILYSYLNTVSLAKIISGSSTRLGSYASTQDLLSHRINILFRSPNILVYKDGVVKLNVEDGTLSSGRIGIGSRQYSSGTNFSNFYINAISPNTPNGISYGIASLSHGGLDENDNVTLTLPMTDVASSDLKIHAFTQSTSATESVDAIISYADANDVSIDPDGSTVEATVTEDGTPKYTRIDAVTNYPTKDVDVEVSVHGDSSMFDSVCYVKELSIRPVCVVMEDDLL